jgi:hypothetical protein
MQTRQSLLKGDRPWCPVDPKHAIHRQAKYDRYANCQELTKSKWIARFLCRPCGHTISVLPDDTLPYRPISVPLTEASFDAKAAGKPQPPVTETERGCLKRAWARLRQRVEVLLAVLGFCAASTEVRFPVKAMPPASAYRMVNSLNWLI